MTYRNLALLLVALVLSFAAAGVWIVYTNQQSAPVTTETTTTTTPTAPVAPQATTVPSQSPDAMLSFTNESMTLGVNEEGEARVKLDTSGTDVTTVSLVVNFDPSTIRVDSITGAGKFDLYLGNTVDSTGGFAKISGATTAGKSLTSDSSFAKIKFTRISAGTTALTVAAPSSTNTSDPYSVIIDNGETQYTVPAKTLTIN
jgi:hypothetical protein